MSNRAAKRRLARALRIGVNKLIVTGAGSERVDNVLTDFDPVRYTDPPPDQPGEVFP